MSKTLKSFLKFSIGTWINAAISLISVPIIAWFIQPEDMGKGAMFTLAVNLLLNIFLLGQDQAYMRGFNDVEGDDRTRLFHEGLRTSLVFGLICAVVLEFFRTTISDFLFGSPDKAVFIDLLLATIIVATINRFMMASIRMQHRAIEFSILQILLSTGNLAFTLALVMAWSKDFRAVVVAFSLSHVLCFIVGLYMTRSIFRWKRSASPSRQRQRELLKYGLPFVPTFVLDWIFQSSDRTMLRLYSTFHEIGIYSTAGRISAGLNILQTGFASFWTPFVFERFTKDENDKSYFDNMFQSVAGAFAVVIMMILIGRELIELILPLDYRDSVRLFPLLLFGPMFYTLSEITQVGIMLRRRTKFHLYVFLVTAAVSASLSYLLIPKYGAHGAVISNFVSFGALFVMRTYYGNKLYPVDIRWMKFLQTFVLLLAAVILSYFLTGANYYVLMVAILLVLLIVNKGVFVLFYQRLGALLKF